MVVKILRPNAAGDETSITGQEPAGGEHWDKVDDIIPDGIATCVVTNSVTYKRDLYSIPAFSGGGIINSIKIHITCYCTLVSLWAKPSLKSGGVVTDGNEVGLSQVWTDYSQQWDSNPADSQPWEWTDIADLQIGVSLKGNGTFYFSECTQVYVEVDYTAGPFPTFFRP